MKLSINDTNKFTKVNVLDEGIDFLAQKIGTQLGAIEDIEDLEPKYKDAIITRIVQCQKHPNADKLSVCLIDDGDTVKDIPRDSNNLITVVCGANNVGNDQLVVWLPPKSVVPATYKKQEFVLSARELRGIMSYGMIASPEELDLNFSNGGILVLEDGQPGESFGDFYNLNDTVIELENKMFTHRPDCFGVIGVARELSAIMGEKFTSPDWYITEPELLINNHDLPFEISIKTENVRRFSAISLKDISVKESPNYIKSSLIKAGIKPINSVVDISNYIMLLTAQPIHIYDYDKVTKLSDSKLVKIIARNSKKSEKVKLLNGKELALDNGAVVIATDAQAIGIGGIMGGSETEVDQNTKNIIIEVANFDMYNIRKTSMKYGLFTDAVTRNTKKQSPLQTIVVLKKTVRMIEENCGGQIASKIADYKSEKITVNNPVVVGSDFINERLGSNLEYTEITRLLELAEFSVSIDGENLVITPPFWRTDISLKEDIVEEIGRLYGFNKLPVSLPTTKLTISKIEEQLQTNQLVRNQLSSFGANELLTYNFVNEKLLHSVDQPVNEAIKITNALSPSLEYYRLSITPNLLEKVHMNHKLGYEEFALFELGKSHSGAVLDSEQLPQEKTNVALLFSSIKNKDSNNVGAPFFVAKKYLANLAEKIGIKLIYNSFSEPSNLAVFGPYEPNRSAEVIFEGKIIGVLGEFKSSVSQKFKLPPFCAGFEINIENLVKSIPESNYSIKSKFPAVKQDITISYPKGTAYKYVEESLTKALSDKITKERLIDLRCSDIYQNNDKINYTFSLRYQNISRTQTIKEINEITEKIVNKLQDDTGGKQIY
jgi:phenylalanyl-tRNA synthetase beta chain